MGKGRTKESWSGTEIKTFCATKEKTRTKTDLHNDNFQYSVEWKMYFVASAAND